jgi:hypothetical protein
VRGPLSSLRPDARRELLADLSYLNLREIRSFCDRRAIPYRILVETPDGRTKATTDTDRKPVVLDRIRRYLATGEVPEATRLPARIVREGRPPAALRPSDRIYYRWYNKTYGSVMGLLRDLTGGRFEDGALARVLIMEYWTDGTAPTFREFADAWVSAKDEPRLLLSADYAFLSDLQRGRAGPEWKSVRASKARRVLATLGRIAPETTKRSRGRVGAFSPGGETRQTRQA